MNGNAYAASGDRLPKLRLQYDALGRPIRVFIDALEVTHLVARVQSNTTMQGTTTEVVLTSQAGRAPALEAKA